MSNGIDADELHGSETVRSAERELLGFIEFIRQHGVVGLAVGIMLGGVVGSTVKALVDGFINPLIGLVIKEDTLAEASFTVHGSVFRWGLLASSIIDLFVITALIYVGFRFLKLEKLEKK